VYRYLNKLWKLVCANAAQPAVPTPELNRLRHKMVYDITTRLENLSLNTVISGFMEHTNTLTKLGGIDKATLETLAVLLAPFAPHMAEEVWQRLGYKDSVFAQSWPVYDTGQMKAAEMELALQINGKLRDNMRIETDADKDAVLAKAQSLLANRLQGAEIVKTIYVPGRIVNFVVRNG
jgi:leucyl-tRNA synthetase